MATSPPPASPLRAYMCADCGFGAPAEKKFRRSTDIIALGIFVAAFFPLFVTGFVMGIGGAICLIIAMIVIALGIPRLSAAPTRVCAECQSNRVIPADSPVGQMMLRQMGIPLPNP